MLKVESRKSKVNTKKPGTRNPEPGTTRIACLRLPDLPLVALLRSGPERLRDVPLAVTAGPGRAAAVLACTDEARELGARPGMTAAQASTVCPELAVEPRQPELDRQTQHALVDLAHAFSPRVEPGSEGLAFFEATGLYPVFGTEVRMAELLLQAASRLGLAGLRVGLAGGKGLARVAASPPPPGGAAARGNPSPSPSPHGDCRKTKFFDQSTRKTPTISTVENRKSSIFDRLHGGEGEGAFRPGVSSGGGGEAGARVGIIPPGQARTFLAPLPLSLLLVASGLDLKEQQRLTRLLETWGLRTAGELGRLSAGAVGARLGAAGLRLHRLARGDEPDPFTPEARPPVFEERLEAEAGIRALEPLLFGLRGQLDRLVQRLVCRGLAARRIVLDLELESRRVDRRTLEVSSPTRDVNGLLALVRLELEREPPDAAVTAVDLALVPQAPRAGQFDLFLPAGPAPLALAATLARLAALLGPGRVGAPELLDSHAPGAFRMVSFEPGAARPRAADARPGAPRLGFRAYRPPRPARVRVRRARPAHLRADGLNGGVRQAAGPWRTGALWWEPAPVEREEWDVELQDGTLLRLVRDVAAQRWVVEGEYD